MKTIKSFRIESEIADELKSVNASVLVEKLLMDFFGKKRRCPICDNLINDESKKDLPVNKKALHKK